MDYNSLNSLEQASSRVLFRAKSLFPFDPFPDVIEVTDTEVKIIFGLMIKSKQVMHMPIKELLNVKLATNLFFGSLTFEIKGYENNPQTVTYLPRQQAIDADAVISGLILCSMNGVDTLQYDPETLLPYLRSIGEVETMAAI